MSPHLKSRALLCKFIAISRHFRKIVEFCCNHAKRRRLVVLLHFVNSLRGELLREGLLDSPPVTLPGIATQGNFKLFSGVNKKMAEWNCVRLLLELFNFGPLSLFVFFNFLHITCPI